MSKVRQAEDASTRDLAVREFARPVLVEAGAGTGKTSLLVARILSWCLGPGWAQLEGGDESEQPDVAGRVARGVVAITFTEKAAAEMASRLGDGFAAISRGQTVRSLPPDFASQPQRRRRALAFLRVLDRFTICTIHAYCRRLLASYPLEAGLRPDFVVDAEGITVPQAVEEVVGAFLRDPPEPLRLAWQQLAAKQMGLGSLRPLIEALVQCGASPQDLDPSLLLEASSGLAHELNEVSVTLRGILDQGCQRSGKLRKALELRDALASLPSPGDPKGYLDRFRQLWREINPENKLRDWSQGKLTQGEQEALGDSPGTLATAAEKLRLLAWSANAYEESLFAALFPVASYLLQEARKLLEDWGSVSFHDLLAKTVALLAANPEVCLRERQRIHQLLVDEFQDTDRWQAQILRLLALSGSKRPGLFVVGDPKQSIYGWRSADLAVYQAFAELLEREGGLRLQLLGNFRSVPRIIREVKRLVGPVMQAVPGLQPSFQDLIPYRQGEGFNLGPYRSVEHWVIRADDGNEELEELSSRKVREKEAEVLAGHICELHHQFGVPFKSMAVLFRALSDVHVYLEAFRAWGVPTVTQRDRTYFERREILDALSLLRAVAEPRDQAALVGYLRSPWAGVPDAAWLPLKEAGFFAKAEALWGSDLMLLQELRGLLELVAARLPASLPGRRRIAGWEKSALWALAVLGRARESWVTDPIDVFMNKLTNWLQFEATEAARFPGRVRLENLARLFQLFRARAEVLGDWRRALATLELAMEHVAEMPLPPQPEAEDAVLLSSIHQVKGLDFDHVFLVDTHRQGRNTKSREVRATWLTGESGSHLVLKVGAWATPNARLLQQWEQKVSEAELVRLLYVAATRARDRLVVCSPWGKKTKAGSLMELLRRRESLPELDGLFQQLPQGGDRIEANGALWVFPKLPTRPAPGEITNRLASFPLEEAKRQAFMVLKRQAWAQEHQQLPLVAPVSAEAHEKRQEFFGEKIGEIRLSGEASLAGTLVHRVLQLWQRHQPPKRELQRWQQELPRLVPSWEDPRVVEGALRWAARLLERFAASPLIVAFYRLGEERVLREFPLILKGDGEKAVGAFVGSVDLVYFSPKGPVVVDFKTDRVEGDDITRRAQVYRPQGQRYCEALQKAWRLATLPSFELWFLWAGVRLRLW